MGKVLTTSKDFWGIYFTSESEIESTVNRKPNYAPFHSKLEFGSNVDV